MASSTIIGRFVTTLFALLIPLGTTELAGAQERLKVEVVPQIGHSSFITAVAFSPDGARLLSGSDDKTIKLWDVASGSLLRTFEGHPGLDAPGAPHSVFALAFLPDGLTFLSSGEDNTVKVRDLATGRLLRSFKARSETVHSVAFSRDGRLAAVGGSYNEPLELWDVATGRIIRTFEGHTGRVSVLALSSDNRHVVYGSGEGDGTLKLRDVATGALLRTFEGYLSEYPTIALSPDGAHLSIGIANGRFALRNLHTGARIHAFEGHKAAGSSAFSSDGRQVLTSGGGSVKLWDTTTGALLRSFEGIPGSGILSPDGRRIASIASDDNNYSIKLWDAATGAHLRTLSSRHTPAGAPGSVLELDREGSRVLAGGMLWDAASGALVRSTPSHSLSPDGMRLLSTGDGLKILEAATGKQLHTLAESAEDLHAPTFSPDGKRVLAISGKAIKRWDAETGRQLGAIKLQALIEGLVAYSPDGKHAQEWRRNGEVKLWSLERGRVVRSFNSGIRAQAVSFDRNGLRVASGNRIGEISLRDVFTGRELHKLKGHTTWVTSAFSPDGSRLLSGSDDGTMKLWDTMTGRLIRSFDGRSGTVTSVAYSRHGRWVASVGGDGTIRMWDVATGQLLVSMVATPDGEWLAITPEGFFNASSPKAARLIGIVRGLDAYGVDQMWQSLYAPDLVREKLAGDTDREVIKAAAVINLDKVLESGKPPRIEISTPSPDSSSVDEVVTVEAAITAQDGGGIGRVEWRVNGITVGVSHPSPGSTGTLTVKQTLALDPGNSTIEVVAYNGRNLLASMPSLTRINWTGTIGAERPKLYVLAIGINNYIDKGGVAPDTTEVRLFPPLGLAASDAKAIGEELKRAGSGLYSEVHIRTVLDEQATVANLDAIVKQMASEIGPRDTFVLYAAAHGYSYRGHFYLIPQDYQGGPDPQALATRAIDQLKIQDWITNHIRAKKALILLDTCESGALIAGHSRSRFDGSASDAAIGRLHEATGRPVLTAAGLGQSALELPDLRYGVFTSALIDSIYRGDANSDGAVSVSELVAHVQNLVPRLIKDPRVRAEVMRRGPIGGSQSVRFGGRGEDFAFVHRLH